MMGQIIPLHRGSVGHPVGYIEPYRIARAMGEQVGIRFIPTPAKPSLEQRMYVATVWFAVCALGLLSLVGVVAVARWAL